MPSTGTASKATEENVDFEGSVCVKEAQVLLNCVAASAYNEYRCIPLLKRLRECIEKKYVVDFTLLPDPDAQARAAAAAAKEDSCG